MKNTRQLLFDNVHIGTKAKIAIENNALEFNKIIERFTELTYIPMDYKTSLKKANRATLTNSSKIKKAHQDLPHPILQADYLECLFSNKLNFAEMFDILGALALSEEFTASEIEMYTALLVSKDVHGAFSEFKRNVPLMRGIGNLYVSLLPFTHTIRNAPIYTFSSEAMKLIEEQNISNDILAKFLKLPEQCCYFHIGRNHSYTLHEGDEATEYKFTGFYAQMSENHSFTIDKNTSDLLRLKSDKPSRLLTITLIGEAEGNITNDLLCKFDLFLQEDQTISDLVESTILWYSGATEADISNFAKGELSILGSYHEGSDDLLDEMNLDHNTQLINVAVNILAFLSFGQYSIEESNQRKLIENIILSKKPKQRIKEAKRVHGIYNKRHLTI